MKDDYSLLTSALLRLRSCRWLLASLLCMVAAVAANAQDTVIKGTVVDETGEPLIGATVLVEGTTVGTATDIDGVFAINASPGPSSALPTLATPTSPRRPCKA